MEYSIRSMELEELKDIYLRIKNDFAVGEYAPYGILLQQLKSDVQKGVILLHGQREVAYSICTSEITNEYILISLMAVFEEYRGKGYGTAFIEELKKLFKEQNGIIIEVEKPEDATDDRERAIREKRIEFYQRTGFQLVKNIEYSIWDVPMHLMLQSQKTKGQVSSKDVGQIMYEIYLALMGDNYIHKLRYKVLE